MSKFNPEFYVPGSSWLHQLDPRTKMCFSLLVVLLCTMTARLDVLFGVLIVTQLVLLLGRLPGSSCFRAWRTLAPLFLVILILQPLLYQGGEPSLFKVGPLQITKGGLLIGLRYSLRIAAAAFATLIPVMTTRIKSLVRGLEKSGLPQTWAMVMGLALRYLSTINHLYQTIRNAQQARGWEPSKQHLLQRARHLPPTLIALIIASLRLSDLLALGLAARGFSLGIEQGRTHWQEIRFKTMDWIALSLMLLSFAGVLWLLL